MRPFPKQKENTQNYETIGDTFLSGVLANGNTYHIRPVWLDYFHQDKLLAAHVTVFNDKGFTLDSFTAKTPLNCTIKQFEGTTSKDKLTYNADNNGDLINASLGEYTFIINTNNINIVSTHLNKPLIVGE